MKKVNKILMRKIAYEERLGIYRLAQNEKIENEEIPDLLKKVEELTEVNLSSAGFDAQSIRVVGIDNCCNYFKSLCQQYYDLVVNSKNGEFITNQERMDITIGLPSHQSKPKTIDIGLYDSSKIMDGAITENYIDLVNETMHLNSDMQNYKYALFSTFANIYYSIRDFIEGKTYYDGQFMTEYRELPSEYNNLSQELISSFMEKTKIDSPEVAKTQLLSTLNDGINILTNIPFVKSVELANEKNLEKKIEELKQVYYAEHGYPESNNVGIHK